MRQPRVNSTGEADIAICSFPISMKFKLAKAIMLRLKRRCEIRQTIDILLSLIPTINPWKGVFTYGTFECRFILTTFSTISDLILELDRLT